MAHRECCPKGCPKRNSIRLTHACSLFWLTTVPSELKFPCVLIRLCQGRQWERMMDVLSKGFDQVQPEDCSEPTPAIRSEQRTLEHRVCTATCSAKSGPSAYRAPPAERPPIRGGVTMPVLGRTASAALTRAAWFQCRRCAGVRVFASDGWQITRRSRRKPFARFADCRRRPILFT